MRSRDSTQDLKFAKLTTNIAVQGLLCKSFAKFSELFAILLIFAFESIHLSGISNEKTCAVLERKQKL